jgi:hypothetical protein
MSWAAEELKTADLGDKRRNQRLIKRTSGHADRKRAIEQKESHRWLESLELTQQWIPQDKKVVTVADREADIYELLALPRREGSEFLIRACHPRGVKQTATDREIESLQRAISFAGAEGNRTNSSVW